MPKEASLKIQVKVAGAKAAQHALATLQQAIFKTFGVTYKHAANNFRILGNMPTAIRKTVKELENAETVLKAITRGKVSPKDFGLSADAFKKMSYAVKQAKPQIMTLHRELEKVKLETQSITNQQKLLQQHPFFRKAYGARAVSAISKVSDIQKEVSDAKKLEAVLKRINYLKDLYRKKGWTRKSQELSVIQKDIERSLGIRQTFFRRVSTGLQRLFPEFSRNTRAMMDFNREAQRASLRLGRIAGRSVFLVTMLGGLFAAWAGAKTVFREAFQAVEKYRKGLAGLTALTLTFIKPKANEGLADQYKRATAYAKHLYKVLEDVAATTLLTGDQANLLAQVFLRNGQFIDVFNKKQVAAFKSIANAIAIVTEGQNKEVQISSEINDLLDGRITQHDRLGQMLLRVDKNLKKHIQTWRQEGTLIEHIGGLLKGFDAVSGQIAATWEAISTKLSTAFSRLSRTAFRPVYEDILNFVNKLTDSLDKNSLGLTQMVWVKYRKLRGILTSLFSVFDTLVSITKKLAINLGSIFLSALLYRGIMRVVKAISIMTEGFKSFAMLTRRMLVFLVLDTLVEIVRWMNRIKDLNRTMKEVAEKAGLSKKQRLGLIEKKTIFGTARIGYTIPSEQEQFINNKQVRKRVQELKEKMAATSEMIYDALQFKGKKQGFISAETGEFIKGANKELLKYYWFTLRGAEGTAALRKELEKLGVSYHIVTLTKILKAKEELQLLAPETAARFIKEFVYIGQDGAIHFKKGFDEKIKKELSLSAVIPALTQDTEKLKKTGEQFGKLIADAMLLGATDIEKIRNQWQTQQKQIIEAFYSLSPEQQKARAPMYGKALMHLKEYYTTAENESIFKSLIKQYNTERDLEELRYGWQGVLGVSMEWLPTVEEAIKRMKELHLTGTQTYLDMIKLLYQLKGVQQEANQKVEDAKGTWEDILSDISSIYNKNTIKGLVSKRQVLQEILPYASSDVKQEIMDELQKTNEAIQEQQAELLKKNYPFKAGLQSMLKEWQNTAKQMYDLAQSTAQAMERAFGDFFFDLITGRFKQMRDIIVGFLESIARAISNLMAQRMVAAILGSFLGGGTTTATTTTASTGGYHLAGYGSLSYNPAYMRASGGSVYAGKAYIVGEQGMELFIPGTSGTIVPNHKITTDRPNVNVAINIENKTGVPVDAEQGKIEFDGEKYIVGVVLKSIQQRGALYHGVKAVQQGV